MIKLVVGLGNPGKEYAYTRHNIGERVVEAYAAARELSFINWQSHRIAKETRPDSLVQLFIDDEYMNLAGQSLQEFSAYYKIEPRDIVVVHDELDLPFGKLQLKFGGSSGGHNGIGSIIESLGSDQFWRLRIGIGRPPTPDDPADYVLASFTKAESDILPKIIDEAVVLLINSIENQLIAVSKTVIF